MPAAQSKDALLAVTQKDFAKLGALLDTITDAEALKKDEDETSIKDVIAHRAHWIGLFQGWYRDGLAGKPVHFPAKGYKWNQLKAYNAALRQDQAALGWAEAKRALSAAHDELVTFIEASSDQDLYAGPMKGAKNDWPAGRWAEAAGPSHYRSAAKYIRARLKQMRS